jgi:hypothetical protein
MAKKIVVWKTCPEPDKTGQATDSEFERCARRINGLQKKSPARSGDENFKTTGQATHTERAEEFPLCKFVRTGEWLPG